MALPLTSPVELRDRRSIVCTYDKAFGDLKPTATSNKATVTLTQGDPVEGSSDPFNFETPTTEINPSINVNDKLEGVLNGEWTYDAPGSTATGGEAGGSQQTYSEPYSCDVQGLVYDASGKATYTRTNVVSSTTDGVTSTDTETVTVNCYKLLVSKTATPSFDQRYMWEITKTVAPAVVNMLQSDTTPVNYTVVVEKVEPPIYENFTVAGSITILNPHPSKAAEAVVVTDRLGNGDVPTVDCPSTSVPEATNGVAGTLTCTYGGAVSTNDPYAATDNVATASFLGIDYASAPVDVDFGSVEGKQIWPSITVTDTNDLEAPLFTADTTSEFNYTVVTTCDNTYYNGETGVWSKTLPNIAQIVETGANDNANVQVNCQKDGAIIIEKLTIPAGNTQLFDFTTDAPGFAGPIQLSHGMTTTVPVSAGAYQITETVPAAGWDLTDVYCRMIEKDTSPINQEQAFAASSVSAVQNPAQVIVGGGETWKCTFTNTQWGNLEVKKIAPDNTETTFDFTYASGDVEPATFATLKHDEAHSVPVRPGYYNVTELVPAGWTLREISQNCNSEVQLSEALQGGGVYPTGFAWVEPGLTTTCVFTNSLPSIVTTKTATPETVPNPGADVTFNISVKNTSMLDPVMITELTDSIYGDITQVQGKVRSTTCVLNMVLQPDDAYSCAFTAYVTAPSPTDQAYSETDVVTATGYTDFESQVSAHDDATVLVLAATAQVGDYVWLDRNPNGATTPQKLAGDGLQNDPANEPGVDGIQVQLWGVGADGLPNTGDDVPADSTTTGADGKYDFTSVAMGTYYMVFIKPAGPRAWSSQPNVGDDSGIDSDVIIDPIDPNRAVTGVINVGAGVTDFSWDAALVDTTGAASSDLGGFVWNDVDRDGIQDAGEVGLSGNKVDLYYVSGPAPVSQELQGGAPLATTTTNSSGLYSFMALDPGTYYVKFNVPVGYTVSPKNASGNSETDSDVDTTGKTVNIVLPSGVTDLTWDAGLFVTPTADLPSDEPMQNSVFIFLPAIQR